jgi:hypothetical protein
MSIHVVPVITSAASVLHAITATGSLVSSRCARGFEGLVHSCEKARAACCAGLFDVRPAQLRRRAQKGLQEKPCSSSSSCADETLKAPIACDQRVHPGGLRACGARLIERYLDNERFKRLLV